MPNPSTPITLWACSDVPVFHQPSSREAITHRRADGADLIVQALDHLRGGIQTDGSSHGAPTLARQKEDLREWARGLGLLLKHANLPAQVVRGGQEHDLFHDTVADRYFKVTRDGVFGFSPGIDLAMVTSQPRFEIVPVIQAEIDGWFQA